jgi:hypothetical protein
MHLEWVYLTDNQKRKKWSSFAKEKKITLQSRKVTRHYRSLLSSGNIQIWIKKIKTKQFRVSRG